jgi:acetyl-CoA C-acetyltransferase
MNERFKSIVITSAARTAIGTLNGSLKKIKSPDLGSAVVKQVIKQSNLQPSDVDELIIGQVLTGGVGQNPARQTAIKSGLPLDKTAYIINQVCGSGLRSVAAAYQAIVLNDSNIIIAGGQENMSISPHLINIRGGK